MGMVMRALAVVAVMLLGLLPSSRVVAGWRSADRPPSNDEMMEPCDGDCGVPDPRWDGAPGVAVGQDAQRFETMHGGAAGDGRVPTPAMRPYWGTMQPYWNAPEPPGLTHRGAQPRGFSKTK